MPQVKSKPSMKFGKSSFRKNLIDSSGFQYADLTASAKKKFDKFFRKHKGKVNIEKTGEPGITITKM